MPRWVVPISVCVVLGVFVITCPTCTEAQPGPVPSLRPWFDTAGQQKYGADTFDRALRLQVAERTDTPHMFTGKAVSHGLTITNLSNGPITIERGIWIEYEMPSGWVHGTNIEAVSKCEVIDPRNNDWKAPVRIDAHATLTVVSWDGWVCGGQCPTACMQNVPAMPGIYRFVLITVPDGRRVVSPTFSIEALRVFHR